MIARRLLVVLALVALAVAATPGLSTAAYVSSTKTTASVRASADWTPPVVAVVSPGAAVQGTTTITAAASDSGLGLRNVTIEYGVAGSGRWTTLCTATAAPWSCAWSTTGLADGSYVLRARARDLAGYETVSDAVRTMVANKLSVVMNDPGDDIRGTVQLSAGAFGTGTLAHTVRIQYRADGTTTWKDACTGLTSPYTCTWNTTSVASGDYELRAQLTAGGTTVTSDIVTEVTVDNVAPTVSMTDPGSPLSGTRTFAATASDTHSGVDRVEIQCAVSTAPTTWKTLCLHAEEPWSCRYDTAQLPNASYAFRAVATDTAGNTTTSASIANRVVDNTISSVSLNDPGDLVARTVTLTANAASTAGITSVRMQYAPGGGSTWTAICLDTSAPWSCTWDTTRVTSGTYQLRAVMIDGTGQSVTSATETTVVDNSALEGADVQAFNGAGSVAGMLDANDTLVFTYSTLVNTASVMSGWNGSATPVRLRLRDGALMWRLGSSDGVEVFTANGSTALSLGAVNLKGDYVKYRTVFFDATMTASTVTVNGLERSVVTVRLGNLASGSTSDLKTVTSAKTMVWSPTSAVTDMFGNRSSTTSVTESGTNDKDF